MSRRFAAWSGWFVALCLLLGLGGPQVVASQGAFPPGAFVVGEDGSRWVVGNGVRLRIAFTADDTRALPSLPEGPTVSSVAEAVVALGGGGGTAAGPASPPPPTAPTPTPRPPNPAETLIGQRVQVCAYNVPFTVEVTRAEWIPTLIGNAAPAGSMWVVAFVNVTNQSAQKGGLYGAGSAKVVDDRGREFDWKDYPPDPNDFVAAYGVQSRFDFQPGIPGQTVMSFLVPADAKSLTLVGKSLSC